MPPARRNLSQWAWGLTEKTNWDRTKKQRPNGAGRPKPRSFYLICSVKHCIGKERTMNASVEYSKSEVEEIIREYHKSVMPSPDEKQEWVVYAEGGASVALRFIEKNKSANKRSGVK